MTNRERLALVFALHVSLRILLAALIVIILGLAAALFFAV